MYSGSYMPVNQDEGCLSISISLPANESELRNLMMDMKKSYFNGKDHILNHDDLYLLLSWMEDIIHDSVKLENGTMKRKKNKKWR